ncbi:MAG TPA: tryptophan-rich sensory protein [Microbacterium sp.]|nr:tryptophan-rich sensory protein [Microbacterium sp.]
MTSSRPASRAEVREERLAAASPGGRSDLARQLTVGVAVLFALTCGVFGSGLLGGSGMQDAQGGALDDDATLLAPASTAFSIWSVIYLGLIGYVIWQALPGQRASARQRAVGWWIAGTAVLNGLWVLMAMLAPLVTTVVVIVLLLALLCWTFRRVVMTSEVRSPWTDLVLIDGVTGLHLGWVSVATAANITTWLQPMVDVGDSAEWIAVGVLGALLVIGLVTSGVTGWRVAPPWAMAWGAVWIGVARLTGSPESAVVGWTAVVVGVLLFAVPLLLRLAVALRSGD